MSNPISIYLHSIPKECISEVFSALAKLGNLNGIEIDILRMRQLPQANDISATAYYNSMVEDAIVHRLYSGDSCELFLKNCIVTYVRSEVIDPKIENKFLRSKIEETLQDIEECKQIIQVEMWRKEFRQTAIVKIYNEIQNKLSECIYDVFAMRNLEEVKEVKEEAPLLKKNFCQGCESGMMNQQGHYGGCITEEEYAWF